MDEYTIGLMIVNDLLSNGWKIVTWNPPGAQGTFTIPSEKKPKGYRGQTGSISLDLIAIHPKHKEWLIGEIKDTWVKIIKDKDPQKILELLTDNFRMGFLRLLVKKNIRYRIENVREIIEKKPRIFLAATNRIPLKLPNFDIAWIDLKPAGMAYDPSCLTFPLKISELGNVIYQCAKNLRKLP